MPSLATTYFAGTATVNQAGTVVTGQGTAWLSAGLQAGDVFWAAGLSVRIASVDSNTQLTLAYGWPGANRAAGQYEVRYTPDGIRALATSIAVNNAIGSGNLYSLGALPSAADKLAYFTGAGVAALTDLTAHGRSIMSLTGGAGKFIRSTAAGAAAMHDIVGQVLQVSGKPTAALIERGASVNGQYVRLADGTQICWIIIDKTSDAWTQSYGGLFVPANQHSWTYPAVFSAQPTIVGTASRFGVGIAAGMMVKDVSQTFSNLIPWICLSTPADVGKSIHVTAYGRWF